MQVTDTNQPAGAHPAGGAALAAVFGQPIAHSKSPVLHRAAYAALGFPMDYRAIEAGTADAAARAAMLRAEPGWRGASVTMPLKNAMVPLMDSVSERVSRLGALNTVVVRGEAGARTLHGENTDVEGIIRALHDAGTRRAGSVAILGAGGTAAAATAAAAAMGATRIDYVVRDAGRAAAVLRLAGGYGCVAEAVPAQQAGERMGGYDAVVSTLPPRAADALLDALRVGSIRPGTALLDVAYDPWPSALARAWADAGGQVAGGLAMLVHQAVEQVRLFTGLPDADWRRVTIVMCDAVGLPHPVS